MRWLVFCCAFALSACAASRAADPEDPPMHGELSLLYDAGEEAPPDLGGGGGFDFGGGAVDLAGGGCNLARVVVNEIQTGGTTGSDEFIELYNPCPNAIDLTGSTVVYRAATSNTDDNTLAKPTQSIAGGGYFLIAGMAYSGTAKADVTYTSGGLAATGGAVGLRAPGGALLDSVGWGSANNVFVEKATATNPAAGHSIARIPNGNDTNDNSADFSEKTSPTPRARNL
ncbi:MAG TPA: lamin tail domain-containing protein [Polyangia bacterium]